MGTTTCFIGVKKNLDHCMFKVKPVVEKSPAPTTNPFEEESVTHSTNPFEKDMDDTEQSSGLDDKVVKQHEKRALMPYLMIEEPDQSVQSDQCLTVCL